MTTKIRVKYDGVELEVNGSSDLIPISNVASTPVNWIEGPSTERFSVNDTTGELTYIGNSRDI